MSSELEAGGFSFRGDYQENRPVFTLGYHDSKREQPLSEMQYGYLLNQDFSVATTPITNSHFKSRVFKVVSDHLATLKANGEKGTSEATANRADPILLPLTPEDTGMFPSQAVNTYVAYTSPWIDLCSTDPVIANISRQVLNLEINYASWCGVKSIIITGPGRDASKDGGSQGIAQYSRAVQEALTIAPAITILIHIPMYREPPVGTQAETLSSLNGEEASKSSGRDIDIFTTWDSWHQIRSVCKYNPRLLVALKMPRVVPEKDLQNRWFCEPLHYLTFSPEVFQKNKIGYPSLTKNHQEVIFAYMRLKNAPWLLLCDVGPDVRHITEDGKDENAPLTEADFPSLEEAHKPAFRVATESNVHCDYLRWLERQQPPFSVLETPILTNFQDWLQSPLQPLSDNLESATYEVFENDAIKYDQYELAIAEALKEWSELKLPTSKPGVVVMAVAGSGRGPIVTKALKAAESTGVKVEVWAVEKNPNAYVYLLRQNAQKWGDSPETSPVYGKVDILISELLGSFGDNELSPECLDGIQHVLAKPHGISIPQSYTAHLSPIATPKLYTDISARAQTDSNAYDTPWVAWEFSHPIPDSTLEAITARRSGGVVGGTGGSMAGAAGANDHNSRFCHLTFVARTRGVAHGLAGYFESTLYELKAGPNKGRKTEISIHPERIDAKSKDMVSWFPIFFPLKQPLYFPADTELEVSMWRQTDDTKVWYEWLVEAWTWVGPSTRVKVASSELCSSRKLACLM
ncbi:PRMT5 TIM barrel domain-containing protein [Trichoderma breve]|uniref:Protein arginine N-methyltransferase n=1 Tax=Trichoderma breve TaxID=2034170 RepID=A0A9W9BJB4_9HYPO|nr:PRMT5 TIM barrel domain-containing protein [Trichoderma breve]KAJ4860908.1 PRMT5 TIM barrel domain-containing protein [Trichoderma breve]